MTQKTFEELKRKSMDKKVFTYCDKGVFYVCEDIGQLPYGNSTLQEFIDTLIGTYSTEINTLKLKVENEQLAIKQLQNALELLNK